jgi:acyl transferase domain-containing protein
MKTVADEYLSMIEDVVSAKAPAIPFYSSVTGKIIRSSGELSASYWVQNLVSPVLFYSAVNQVLATLPSPKTFLEIGPHSVLAGPIRQALRNNDSHVDYVATLVRNNSAVADLLNTAGQLWLRNIDVGFSRIIPHGKFLTDLPSYPWHYQGKHWAESRLSKEWRLRKFPHHDILGTRVIQSTDLDPSWRNILRLDSVPWIRDHEIAGDVLFPGAAFIAMVGEAIRQLSPGWSDYTIRRVNISTALVLPEGNSVEIVTNLRPVRLTRSLDSCWYDFTVSSLHGNTWTKHVSGQVRAGSEFQPETPPLIEPLPRKLPSSVWYRVMKRFGLNYGPKFRQLKNISAGVSGTKAVATLAKGMVLSEPRQLNFLLTMFQKILTLKNHHIRSTPPLLMPLSRP